jgi:hypothetical protein
MAEIDRARIQSLYSELKGYLESLPTPKGFNGPNRIGRRFNIICDELSSISRTRFTHLKLDEDDDEDHNGYGFDGATLKSSIAGLVSRLESDYGFGNTNKTNSQPAIVINNQNSNTIDININFTLETLINTAETEEEKAQLEALDKELKKPNANWDKIKGTLSWIFNYSKDLSLKVLPIVLDHYLKK